MADKFVVNVSVTDLRQEPIDLLPKNYSHHNLRNTQVLFGEYLLALEEKEEWIKVQALEQMHYTEEKKWHPYEGWIKKEEVFPVLSFHDPSFVVSVPSVKIQPQNMTLLFGTYLCGDPIGNLILPNGEKAYCPPSALRTIPKKIDRNLLTLDAKQFLKAPYLWGGRGFPIHDTISSVDCSALINLIYRAQGVSIPRDAHPQCLFGKEKEKPQIGDPIYLSKEIHKVTHVILKIEDPYYIEAPETGKYVRLLKWGEDIWQDEGKYYFHDRSFAYKPYFRCFF